ncbi:MAG TPA: hypothetical protein VK302_07195 [Terriglobales bacterium]|nr:hypothetical protein [Terriglobales bacterium]
MKKVQAAAVSKMLLAVLGVSLVVAGIAAAQVDIPVFMGKFTLTSAVHWDDTVLQPGDYTITVGSIGTPTAALVRDGSGRPVARFMTGIDDGRKSATNALLIQEKGGELRVYALALAGLGKVLVYDPALAREAALEARAPQTVPVTLAER